MMDIKKYFPFIVGILPAVFGGFVFYFMKIGLQVVEYDSVKYLAFRFLTGFIVLTILVVTKLQKVDYKNKPIILLLLCGALNPLISQVIEAMAVAHSPTSQIAIIFSLQPVLIVVLSVIINNEIPTKRQVLFMIVCIAGVLLINTTAGMLEGGTTMGLFIAFSALVVISVQRVFVRRASGSFTSFEIVYVTTGMGALGFSIVTLFQHAVGGRMGSLFNCLLSLDFVISILYMGIVSCVLGFLCSTYAIGRLPIAVSSSVGMLSTVISILVGVFILKETFRLLDVLGTVILLSGIVGMSLSYSVYNSNRFNNEKVGSE